MADDTLLQGKRILLVDDEPDVLDVLEDLLPMCDILRAQSFAEARDLLLRKEFDLAVLDIMGVRGYDLLDLANRRGIPAVMLTAHAFSPDHLARSIRGGAASYIPKEEITRIRDFLSDVLKARARGESPWRYWEEKLPSSYFERRWGAAWQDADPSFWESFRQSLRAPKKGPSEEES